MFGGGLINVVALGESAGAGAGVVASRATTAAGIEAELEVPPERTALSTAMPGGPDAGLSALGGSFGGGWPPFRLGTQDGVD